MVIVQPSDLPSVLEASLLGAAVDPCVPLVVDLAAGDMPPGVEAGLGTYPAVTVGIAVGAVPTLPVPTIDILLTDQPDLGARREWIYTDVEGDLAAVTTTISRSPIAARVLTGLLRHALDRGVDDGLIAESAAYSTLQAGPELATWLASCVAARSRPASADGEAVVATRDGAALMLELNRPHVRNAFNASMRERLVDLLAVAVSDPTVERILISGRGEVFCAGGDLSEFGTAADPAQAHLLRLDRSPARFLARLASKVEARVHGSCIGAGIELPAFASHLIAAPDTTFSLPEVGMGLIPGAGGTVSIPWRIGAQRTTYLALIGRPVDTATALSWGLIDDVAATTADVD